MRLCFEQLFPVCSPRLIAGLSGKITAADLLKFPLLHLDDWKTGTRWFEAAGVTHPHPPWPALNRASMLIDAAADGQGVALARTALAAGHHQRASDTKPIDVSLTMANTYWIVCPKVSSGLPKIATFRDWVLAEAAEDASRLEAQARGARARWRPGRFAEPVRGPQPARPIGFCRREWSSDTGDRVVPAERRHLKAHAPTGLYRLRWRGRRSPSIGCSNRAAEPC